MEPGHYLAPRLIWAADVQSALNCEKSEDQYRSEKIEAGIAPAFKDSIKANNSVRLWADETSALHTKRLKVGYSGSDEIEQKIVSNYCGAPDCTDNAKDKKNALKSRNAPTANKIAHKGSFRSFSGSAIEPSSRPSALSTDDDSSGDGCWRSCVSSIGFYL